MVMRANRRAASGHNKIKIAGAPHRVKHGSGHITGNAKIDRFGTACSYKIGKKTGI